MTDEAAPAPADGATSIDWADVLTRLVRHWRRCADNIDGADDVSTGRAASLMECANDLHGAVMEVRRERRAPAGPQAEGIDGASLIAVERRRQVEQEGWTPGHDQQHTRGGPRWPSSLAHAATAYVHRNNAWWPWLNRPTFTSSPTAADRTRELAKAGALIAADLDLLNGTAPARLQVGGGPWASICGEQWRTGDHVWTCTEPPGHTKGGCRDGNLPCGCEHDASQHTCPDADKLNHDDPADGGR